MFVQEKRWVLFAAAVFGFAVVAGCAGDNGESDPGEAIDQQAQGVGPAAPTQISPSGAASATPTFVWNSVAGATDYLLWVRDSVGDKLVDYPVTAAVACNAAGQCSTTPPIVLADGLARWWIRAKAGTELGPWSSNKNFTVTSLTQKPGQVETAEPTGTVGTTPTYKWKEITGPGAASSYLLQVDDVSQKKKIYLTFPAAGNCTAGNCSVTPATVLSAGAATFWVQAKNALGDGPWSTGRAFTVSTATNLPPPPPALTNPPIPPATVTTSTPTYEWTASPGATLYKLYVDGFGAPGVINNLSFTPAQANCDADSLCTVTPSIALADGTATAWARGYNSAGYSPWSPPRTFTVNADQCALNTDNCDPAATCTNTPTGFTCACPAGQIGNGLSCSCNLSGTFAVLDTLNVEWDPVSFQGTPVFNGGSATTSSWSIRQQTVVNGTLNVDTIPCGATSPDICSPLLMQAFSQTLPDSIWQGPNMPVAHSTMALSDPDPGEAFVGPTQALLGGIDLTSPLAAWPPAYNSPGIIGFPDHDSDTVAGMTQFLKNTGTSASCGFPYANLPVTIDMVFGSRVDRVYVGSRQLSNYDGTIASCDRIEGTVRGPSNGMPQVNGHVRGCHMDNGTPCTQATFELMDSQGQGVGQRIVGSHFTMKRVQAGITCASVRSMSFQ